MGKVHDVIERVFITFYSKIPISFPHFTHTHTGTHTLTHARTAHTAIYIQWFFISPRM